MSKQFDKMVVLLKELFQLDQPDLDFGLYRIMHAKAEEITRFLEKELLPQVKEAFSQYTTADKAELEKELKKAIEQANSLGVDPETTAKVKELRRKIADESVDVDALENEVYDHLYSFFRRYYHDGDFHAKRVYKPGVYAIPYEGEEVKLHWANRDQYYIKTSEYLRDYAFTLRPGEAKDPMRVHFRLSDVAEGEHGNVKPANGKERVFILAAENFIAEEHGELVIRFQYRPATMDDWPQQALKEATAAAAKKPPTQKELLTDAVKRVLAVTDPALKRWIDELARPHVKTSGDTADYSRLEGHLNRYSARHTFDYFVHKDLGGFLRHEMDFYVKNEIMHLDDVESENAARVEQYLSKIKVIRKIAYKLIDFLAQLEDFQKRLWLKRKFVIETNYCMTLDRIPEEFYSEIAANDAQREEWERLFSINEITGDLGRPGYSKPLTKDFLKSQPGLPIDTAYFNDKFKMDLMNGIVNVEDEIDGILVQSDNFQMLRLFSKRYAKSIDACYADPPYNTDAAPIVYKNNYRASSWLAMMDQVLTATKEYLRSDGVQCVTIDDYHKNELALLMAQVFGDENILGTICIRINPSGRVTLKGFAQAHEYALFAGASREAQIWKMRRTDEQAERYKEKDDRGPFEWRNFRREGSASERASRPRRHFPIYVKGSSFRVPEMTWDDVRREYVDIEPPAEGEVPVCPIDTNGGERVWRWGIDRIRREPEDILPKTDKNGTLGLYYKYRPNEAGVLAPTVWVDKKYSATEYGTARLKALFGERNVFDFPKSVHAVEDCIDISGMRKESAMCLDYFAGSGTTAEAVINLNRRDEGIRKFVLCESDVHFDSALKPRVLKAAYASDWKDGKTNFERFCEPCRKIHAA